MSWLSQILKKIIKNIILGALLFPVITMIPIAISVTPARLIWAPVTIIIFICWLIGWFISNFYTLLRAKK